MRALLQRVSQASVVVEGQTVGEIGPGFLILLGIGANDSEAQIKPLVEKIINLRVFEDQHGKMNLSLLQVQGQALVVSQFTLYADMRRGRRPGFIDAASPSIAEPLFERFKAELTNQGITVASGIFGADMQVHLINDGPVTLWLDSEEIGIAASSTTSSR